MHGLAGTAIGLLREVADRGRRRGAYHRAVLGAGQTREHAQQGGLARAVRPDHSDHIAWAEHQIDLAEQRSPAVSGSQALGDEGGVHTQTLPAPPSEATRSVSPPVGAGPSALGVACQRLTLSLVRLSYGMCQQVQSVPVNCW